MFIFQFKNPLILLLLASALVSVLTKEYEDAISIAMVSAPRGGQCPEGLAESVLVFVMQGKKSLAVDFFRKRKHNRKKGQEIHILLYPQIGRPGSLAVALLAVTLVASGSLPSGTML